MSFNSELCRRPATARRSAADPLRVGVALCTTGVRLVGFGPTVELQLEATRRAVGGLQDNDPELGGSSAPVFQSRWLRLIWNSLALWAPAASLAGATADFVGTMD